MSATTGSRASRICDVRHVVGAFIAVCCMGPVFADETRWRVAKPIEGTLMLYTAYTDEATDAVGALVLECKAGSGLAKVDKVILEKSERAAIAKLVLNDSYPTVELDPGPEKSSLDAISSSDASGWGYSFQISADAPSFDLFGKTGIFRFKIGGASIQAGIKAGLDKIAEFQSACRKPSDTPKASK